MPIIDDINQAFRDFTAWNAQNPLPVGDPRSGVHNPSKADIRGILLAVLQATGNPDALQSLISQLGTKAELANSGKTFVSRASAVSAGQEALPAALGQIETREGDYIVLRSPNATADDPLFATAPRWGVVGRYPSRAVIDAIVKATTISLENVGGTANDITAVLPGVVESVTPVAGAVYEFRAATDSTGNATLNISGSGARPITSRGGGALAAGHIKAGRYYRVRLSGTGSTRFELVNGDEADNLTASLSVIWNRGARFYLTRSEAVANLPSVPSATRQILVTEGSQLVIRSRTQADDDPLFPGQTDAWGVRMRIDSIESLTAQIQNLIGGRIAAEASQRNAQVGAEAAARGADIARLTAQINDLTTAGVAGFAGPFATTAEALAGTAPGDYFLLRVGDGLHLYENRTGSAEFVRVWVGGGTADYSPERFGFNVAASAADNGAAIRAALIAAEGRPVVIPASADFKASPLNLPPLLPINLLMEGPGSWDTTDGTLAMVAGNPYQMIRPITGFERVSLVIDGSPTSVTRIAADSTSYSRGQVVRVVSDDIEPQADDSAIRRMGESAIVAAVEPGFIYLADVLEAHGQYVTSPRIGILPDIPFNIDLRIKSSLDSIASLFILGPFKEPRARVRAENHGRIVFELRGGYRGDAWVQGSGKGDGNGSLGYLINEVSGTGNRYHHPKASFFRHAFTDNHNPVPAGSPDLHLYGRCRDARVIGGNAHGSQGSPWDTHPGSLRTHFDDCISTGALRNSASARTAYQVRGTDVIITGGYVDESHDAAVRLSRRGRGNLKIAGLKGDCPAFQLSPGDAAVGAGLESIYLSEPDFVAKSAQTMLEDMFSEVRVTVIGGRIGMSAPRHNSAQILSAQNAARWFFVKTEFFFEAGPATGLRFIRGNDLSRIAGSIRFRRASGAQVVHILRSDGGAPRFRANMIWMQGHRPPTVFGNWGLMEYTLSDLDNLGSDETTATTISRLAALSGL